MRFASILSVVVALGVVSWDAHAKPQRPAPKDPAPTFKLRALDGAVHRLTDFAFPGKARGRKTKQPLLLDFFRTDCEPCVKSLPELVELHKTYEPKGLKIVMVALLEEEKGRAKLEAFLKDKTIPFLLVVDPTDYVAERYLGKTVSLPATFLIDEDGVIQRIKYDAKGSLEDYFKADLHRVLPKTTKETP